MAVIRESVVRAWVALNEEGARAQADASTARWRSGRRLSQIDGMPVGIKDLVGPNGDTVATGQYSISTSNRNFEGRQGVGARTLLVSPFTAAASAVRGRITDPRELL